MSRSAKVSVGVVVLAKNEEEHIDQCVRSVLEQQTVSPLELVVVDNDSEDDTAERARRAGAKVVRSSSRFLGELRNLGAQTVEGDVVAYIDADCSAPRSWIAEALTHLENPGVSAVSGLVTLPPKPTWVELAWVLPGTMQDARSDSNKVYGASFFCRRSAFDEVGGFDSQKTTGEDTDIGCRLVSAGHVIVLEPRCSVIHWGYPKTLRGVVDRQAWHVAGRTGGTPVVRDPTVVAGLGVVTLTGMAIIAACIGRFLVSALFIGLASLPPSVFLARRVRRMRARLSPKLILQALVVSVAYFLGRAKGALHFILGVPFRRSYK